MAKVFIRKQNTPENVLNALTVFAFSTDAKLQNPIFFAKENFYDRKIWWKGIWIGFLKNEWKNG